MFVFVCMPMVYRKDVKGRSGVRTKSGPDSVVSRSTQGLNSLAYLQ